MPGQQQWTEDEEKIRQECSSEIDKQARNKDINVNHLVHFYRERYPGEPILRLVQHINQRIGIYSNILEEIKKISPGPTFDKTAQGIKHKYETLGLVERGLLPNPAAASIAAYILEKLAAFGRSLLQIMSSYTSDLARELRIEPTVTMLIEVEVGWSPKFVIGMERAGSRVRADTAQ